MDNKDINGLLAKPLWQLTGSDYVALHAYASSTITGEGLRTKTVTKVTSIRSLATYLSCSESTIYSMRREGVLDEAIISHIGKSLVFDVEKALELADEYKKRERFTRK